VVRVNVIGWNNGVGLARDMRLLADALGEAGYAVTLTSLRRGKLRKWFRPLLLRLFYQWQRLSGRYEEQRHDINLMLEHRSFCRSPAAICSCPIRNGSTNTIRAMSAPST